jgi:hypothetical protein
MKGHSGGSRRENEVAGVEDRLVDVAAPAHPLQKRCDDCDGYRGSGIEEERGGEDADRRYAESPRP